MQKHKHTCTHPPINTQMDICMNLIALQSYPLNTYERLTPNKLILNEYTRQEKVVPSGRVCYLDI